MALTTWMPANVQPFHKGLYQRKSARGATVFSYYDGKQWYVGGSDGYVALHQYQLKRVSLWTGLPWRGIDNPPDSRRNIGAAVNMIANANPRWPHARVLALAKNLVTSERLSVTFAGMSFIIPNPFFDCEV